MAQLDQNDLAQMNEDYFKSLKKERLVEVAKNLHILATDLWEKQQQNSENSSQPPSLDSPYASKSVWRILPNIWRNFLSYTCLAGRV